MSEKSKKTTLPNVLALDHDVTLDVLNATLSLMPDGIAVYDPDDRLVALNDAFREGRKSNGDYIVLGTTFEEQIKQGIRTDSLGQTVSAEGLNIEERIEKHRSPLGPFDMVTTDGRIYEIEEIKNEAGYTVCTRVDKTELRHAELELEQRAGQLSAFIENSLSAIHIKNTDGRYIIANKVWHDWYNPKGLDITQCTVFDFVPEDLAKLFYEGDQVILSTGKKSNFEAKVTRADGSVIDSNIQRFPILSGDGTIIGTACLTTDVSKSAAIRESLRQNVAEKSQELQISQIKYRTLFENANDGILIRETQSRKIIDLNKNFAEMLGYSTDELLGRGIEIFASLKPHGDEKELSEKPLSGEQKVEIERKFLRKDHTKIDVEIRSSRMDWDGRDIVVSIIRDISERKKNEKFLAESEARFRDFAESAADRFWEVDEELRYTYVSEHEKARFTPEEMIGKRRWELPEIDADSENWVTHRRDMEAHREIRNFQFS
jgi:PAS domain S-box-containing protein